jgi:hypothetical protein
VGERMSEKKKAWDDFVGKEKRKNTLGDCVGRERQREKTVG